MERGLTIGPSGTVATLRGSLCRVGEVLGRGSDLVHEPVQLRGREEADVVFLEDSLDAGAAPRLLGAELADNDRLEFPELGVGVLVEGLPLDGRTAGGDRTSTTAD
jgi:hypothetical protein